MTRHISLRLIAAVTIFAIGVGIAPRLLGGEPDIEQQFSALADSSCIQCHDGSEPNGLDVSLLTGNLNDRATFALWEKIYDRVTAGEMPPPEEPRPHADEQQSALSAISKALTDHNRQQQAEFGRTVLRRLTRTELQHTLNDLLSIDINLDEILPPENTASAFDTIAEKQGLSEIHVRAYLTAADAAIEQAIELRPKPKTKSRTFVYKKQKAVRSHLEKKDKNQEKVILKELDDAVVMFDTASYLFKLDDFYVDSTGRYRITATASSYQSDQPVTLTINEGHYEKGYKRVIGAFDLAPAEGAKARKKKSPKSHDPKLGKRRTVSVETTLRRGSYVFPGANRLRVQSDGKTVWNLGPDKYGGDGIAIQSMEIRGPLSDDWPPRSTTRLLQGTELKELEKKQWDPTRQTHIGYQITTPEDPKEQLQKIIKWLAPRAFRRSLRPGEGKPFLDMGMAALAKDRSFDEAVRVTCKSILTSPEFLFMSPAPGPLDDFSLAGRLSYFLWKSVPDQKLFKVAGAGKLTDKKELRKQVNRMLDHPNASRFISDFCAQWLRLQEIAATAPDKLLYPEFDELLQESMIGETEFFVAHLIEEDLSVSNLIDSKFTFLNRRLAEHYEIDGVKGQRIKKINLKSDSVRGGLLTQASILKLTSNGTTTSPIRRGAWMLTHLLGQPPSPPPPNIPAVEPDTRGAKTIRELLEKHRNEESCNRCHQMIDPPGFALESFDVIGGLRTRYRSLKDGQPVEKKLLGRNIWEYKDGLPVDASGTLPDNESFQNINEFKGLLLQQKRQIARNLIEQLVIYSTGAEIQFSDRVEIESILEDSEKNDWGLRTLIHNVIQSPLFLNK